MAIALILPVAVSITIAVPYKDSLCNIIRISAVSVISCMRKSRVVYTSFPCSGSVSYPAMGMAAPPATKRTNFCPSLPLSTVSKLFSIPTFCFFTLPSLAICSLDSPIVRPAKRPKGTKRLLLVSTITPLRLGPKRTKGNSLNNLYSAKLNFFLSG